jgi:NAD(P)-dependent dehydrogenase (short-subunit alcohol dehydrogenase family)
MKLRGKVIVITGACGLLGREFVKTCLQEGAIVVLADISKEAGLQSLREINNPNAFFEYADITNENSILSLINNCKNKFNKIDALVNNAYPRNNEYGKKLEEVSLDSFNENVNLHLGGFFLCMKTFSKFFSSQGFGNIVSMGSIYGVVAPRFEIYENTEMTMPVEYAAIKSGIIHLTRYFDAYYKNRGVRFNALSPGGIYNNQPEEFVHKYNTYSPMLNVTDLCPTLVYLLSDESNEISGKNFIIDKGWSKDIMPKD